MKKEHIWILAAAVLLYLWLKRKPAEDVTVNLSFPTLRETSGDLLDAIAERQGPTMQNAY